LGGFAEARVKDVLPQGTFDHDDPHRNRRAVIFGHFQHCIWVRSAEAR
jgi:hypothetical protein